MPHGGRRPGRGGSHFAQFRFDAAAPVCTLRGVSLPTDLPPAGSAAGAQRWPWLAATFVLLVLVALTAHGDLWTWVGVQPMRPMFADWVNVLSSAETFAAGGNPYLANPTDPHGRMFSYGPWWLWLGALGLTRADAWWLGVLLALAFLAAAAAVVRPRDAREAGWFAALLVSPPVLLGLERGNSDLVIFVLIALAGWLVGRERSHAAQVAATGVLVSAAALKLYPLVALTGLGARRGPCVGRVIWMGAGAAVFWAAWWLQPEDYVLAIREAIRPVSVFTFGLPLLPTSWRVLAEFRVLIVLGVVPVLAWGLWRVWRTRAEWAELFPREGGRAAAVVAGTTAWLLCYGGSISFQYRGVLVLFAVPFLLGRPALRWAVAWLVAVFWLTAPLFWLAPDLLDDGWRRWCAFISGVQQAGLGVVTLGLALALLGWARRRCAARSVSAIPAAPKR